MSVSTVEINARQDTVKQPILWRLGKLFNVVTNIRRARVTDDYGFIVLEMEGSNQEIQQATDYLIGLGLVKDRVASSSTVSAALPETAVAQTTSIYVRLDTVNAAQGHAPILYRVGKDFDVVVNIERAAFDEEEGGFIEVTLSGPLNAVQRAIAYLHTTGIHVNPRQRSVTDYSNL